jgi:hypothetical protein
MTFRQILVMFLLASTTCGDCLARLCDVTIKFFENITTMSSDAAMRIVPYLAANAAVG